MACVLRNVPLGTTTNLTASKRTGGDVMLTQGKDGADRVRVDRAGRSLDDRKRMDDYIHQVWDIVSALRFSVGLGNKVYPQRRQQFLSRLICLRPGIHFNCVPRSNLDAAFAW